MVSEFAEVRDLRDFGFSSCAAPSHDLVSQFTEAVTESRQRASRKVNEIFELLFPAAHQSLYTGGCLLFSTSTITTIGTGVSDSMEFHRVL